MLCNKAHEIQRRTHKGFPAGTISHVALYFMHISPFACPVPAAPVFVPPAALCTAVLQRGASPLGPVGCTPPLCSPRCGEAPLPKVYERAEGWWGQEGGGCDGRWEGRERGAHEGRLVLVRLERQGMLWPERKGGRKGSSREAGTGRNVMAEGECSGVVAGGQGGKVSWSGLMKGRSP